jgi:hypothetical protein
MGSWLGVGASTMNYHNDIPDLYIMYWRRPNLVVFLDRTPVFEWCVVRCGSKNGYHNNMWFKETRLVSSYVAYFKFNIQHLKWGDDLTHAIRVMWKKKKWGKWLWPSWFQHEPVYTMDHEVRPWKTAFFHGPTSWFNLHGPFSFKNINLQSLWAPHYV